ncbi:MAG: acyloxyacyl hydrolase [Caulobacteraceae bacterium]
MRPGLSAFAVMPAVALVWAGVGRAGEVFGGLYAHDLDLGIAVCCYEHGADIEFGGRTSPIADLHRFGSLRLYALGSANATGGVSFAAVGAAWRLRLSRRFYLQAGLGGAVQNGDADQFQRRPNHLDLGSRFLFEPEAGLGYVWSERWSSEISYVHLSHAQLAGPQNPGMDDLGVRLVYRFGR